MTLPSGSFAPIPTPLGHDDSIDSMALKRHLKFLSDGGIDGVLVQGTNGEFPSFHLEERLRNAEDAARFSEGLSIMLGVGSCALPEVIELVRAAARLEYLAVLLPPPFYFRSAPIEGLAAFFRTVFDTAELPVLLYHIPQVTGIAISNSLLDLIDEHPGFAGIKDSSGSEDELERFISRLGDRSYLVGTDRLISKALAAGGSGSITAAASVVPALVAATLRDATRQPDLDTVRGLLESYGLGPAVKVILRDRGFGDYRTRPPLLDLEEESANRLVKEFNVLVNPPG